MILRHELDNLFYWRNKLLHCGSGIKDEENIMNNFCDRFDPNDVGEQYHRNTPYYYDYLHYKHIPCNDSRLKRKIKFCYAKIFRGMRICNEHGIQYVIKRLINQKK